LRQIIQSIEQALVFNDRQPIEVVHHHRAAEGDLLGDVRSRAMLGQQFVNSVASREVGACHRA
jgi:predicted ATP-dependent protease